MNDIDVPEFVHISWSCPLRKDQPSLRTRTGKMAPRNERNRRARDDNTANSDDDGSDSDSESSFDSKKYSKMKTVDLISEVRERHAKMRKIEGQLENSKSMVNRMTADLEEMRQEVKKLSRIIEDDNNAAGASTILTQQTGIVSLAQSFTGHARAQMGKLIRNKVFKKHKITNKRSFENGEIQRFCQGHLGKGYLAPDMMLAFRDSFIQIANYELGQKRSIVNAALLKKWKGKST